MLSNIEGNKITSIPHREDYERWRANLSDSDYKAIIDELHRIMNEGDVFTSSYLPGSDWTGTVYQPIYIACGESFDAAKLFYGILVWIAVQLHPEEWRFTRQERDDESLIGLTYFRGKRTN